MVEDDVGKEEMAWGGQAGGTRIGTDGTSYPFPCFSPAPPPPLPLLLPPPFPTLLLTCHEHGADEGDPHPAGEGGGGTEVWSSGTFNNRGEGGGWRRGQAQQGRILESYSGGGALHLRIPHPL